MTVTASFDELHACVERELKQAKRKLVIAVAWMNFERYADLLQELAEKGVRIRIVCTDAPSNRKHRPVIDKLAQKGIEVRLFQMPKSHNHMHHKFSVIDEATILAGSFNWSTNAVNSFENVLVIRDEPKVVTAFLGEFEKIMALNKGAVRSLQSLKRCRKKPKCKGHIVNLLVFSAWPMKVTNELWGNVAARCVGLRRRSNPAQIG